MKLAYDHYKDSAAILRERERSRDRLFLFLILELAFLALATFYAGAFRILLTTISVAGIKAGFGGLPWEIVILAIWAGTFFTSLRYGQTALTVERQYKYIHKVEDELSQRGNLNFFTREGLSYRSNYPLFSSWVRLAYQFIFPVLLILAIATLAGIQVLVVFEVSISSLAGVVFAACIVLNFVLLRIVPALSSTPKKD